MLNTLAIYAYVIAAIPCLIAALATLRTRRSATDALIWLAAMGLLLAMSAARANGLEDILRETMREAASSGGWYGSRRNAQVLAITAVLVLVLAAGSWWALRGKRNARRGSLSIRFVRAALIAMLAFAALYALRIVSMHAVDQLLYAGPVRLNWVLDAGLTASIAIAALLYIRHCWRYSGRRGAHKDYGADAPASMRTKR